MAIRVISIQRIIQVVNRNQSCTIKYPGTASKITAAKLTSNSENTSHACALTFMLFAVYHMLRFYGVENRMPAGLP